VNQLLVLYSIGGHGPACSLEKDRKLAIYGHGGHGLAYSQHHQRITQHNVGNIGMVLIVFSKIVDSGPGGLHMIAYSNLQTKLQLVPSGTGGYGVVFGKNQDIQHVISGHGGHGNVYSLHQVKEMMHLTVGNSGIHGRVSSLNVVSGVGGGHGIVGSHHLENHQHVLSGTGGYKDVSTNNLD